MHLDESQKGADKLASSLDNAALRDFSGIVVGHPTTKCSADPKGSGVQPFEDGWLLAKFVGDDEYLYAIAKNENGSVH